MKSVVRRLLVVTLAVMSVSVGVASETVVAGVPSSATTAQASLVLTPLWMNRYRSTAQFQSEDSHAIASAFELRGGANPGFDLRHYVLASRQDSVSQHKALVLKLDADGNRVTSWGTNGWKQLDTNMFFRSAVFHRNATPGVGYTRAYFVGSKPRIVSGQVFSDVAVLCFDFSTSNGHCSGWPTGSLQTISFGDGMDYGHAIVHDPDGYLYVAASVTTPQGLALGVVSLHALNGQRNTLFGTAGQSIYAINGSKNYVPSHLNMALAPSSAPGGKRIYVGGSYRTFYSDRDGFIFSIAVDGTSVMRAVHYESDNSSYLEDAVTAMAVQSDGKLVFAGWSETDNPELRKLLLGRLAPQTLAWDTGFCGGGQCASVPSPAIELFIGKIHPRAIGTRSSDGALVLAMDGNLFRHDFGEWAAAQTIDVWTSDGRINSARDVRTYDTEDPTWVSAMEVDDSKVMITGKTQWFFASNTDLTVTRYSMTGTTEVSVFSNGFE